MFIQQFSNISFFVTYIFFYHWIHTHLVKLIRQSQCHINCILWFIYFLCLLDQSWLLQSYLECSMTYVKRNLTAERTLKSIRSKQSKGRYISNSKHKRTIPRVDVITATRQVGCRSPKYNYFNPSTARVPILPYSNKSVEFRKNESPKTWLIYFGRRLFRSLSIGNSWYAAIPGGAGRQVFGECQQTNGHSFNELYACDAGGRRRTGLTRSIHKNMLLGLEWLAAWRLTALLHENTSFCKYKEHRLGDSLELYNDRDFGFNELSLRIPVFINCL